MRSRDPGSASHRSRITDIDVNQPPERAHDPEPPPRGGSFRERHALKVMGVVMAVMFATVIVAQVGC